MIDSFCADFQLDFGELDILRDNKTQRIYIIDVNKTPYSPPADLPKNEKRIVVNKIAHAFKSEFLTQKEF